MSYNTPEGRIKKQVTQLLKQYGVWYFLPANNGFGKSGIPDYVSCVNGTLVGIECKANKTKKPTALQLRCGREIIHAGGKWLVVCDEATLAELETIIKELGHVSNRTIQSVGFEAEQPEQGTE